MASPNEIAEDMEEEYDPEEDEGEQSDYSYGIEGDNGDEDDDDGDDDLGGSIGNLLHFAIAPLPDGRISATQALLALSTGRSIRSLFFAQDAARVLQEREQQANRAPFVPTPSDRGRELMTGSDFGSALSTGRRHGSGSSRQRNLLEREMGKFNSPGQMRASQQDAVRSYLPERDADFLIEYDYHGYIGRFSEDGNFFYSCSQDMCVRMYDTSDPYDWKYYKTVQYVGGQWAITDASLSPDNKYLAYVSIASSVHLADTSPGKNITQRLDLSAGTSQHAMHPHSGIMSVRFSGDGNELLVGAKDRCVYIYDIAAGTPVLRLRGHNDEVNAVCYGDATSPHIIYSGSDDSTIKIWDRRSIADGKPVGVFTGHMEGITFVDSKGDGRYVLSNGKDQQMKLWDLRNMMDPQEFEKMPRRNFSSGFDYRMDKYSGSTRRRHPADKSLVTYRGHSVHCTLIRCYFSPSLSTGSSYVYSGSTDGRVKIYNIDSTVAREIDIHRSTASLRPNTTDSRRQRDWWHGSTMERTCVRDVSWHPSAPVFAATCFQGNGAGTGAVSVHSWRGAGVESCDDNDDEGYAPRVYTAEMEARL